MRGFNSTLLMLCMVSLLSSQQAGHLYAAGQPVRMADGSLPPRIYLRQARRGFVTFDQLIPLAQPFVRKPASPNQHAKDAKPLGFIEKRYAVLANQADGDSTFLLLGDSKSGKPVGWIESDFFLDRVRCLEDPETTIPRKAMIRTPENVLRKESQGDVMQASAAILYAPHSAAAQRKQFAWFSYHFVYDHYSNAKNSYVLIGSGESFSPIDNAAEVRKKIHGWVKKAEICAWNTREAFWWNHQNATQRPPGKVWEYEKTAVAQRKGQRENSLFEEIKNPNPPPQAKSRFPKLSHLKYPRQNSRLYKIGWIAQKGADGKELQEIQRRLIELKNSLNQIDVVFVIDDTLSMKRWFTVTNNIVDAIRNALEEEDARVRIAISYFNDAIRGTGQHRPDNNRLQPIGSVAANKQLRELRNHREVNNVNADPHEMMFDGMKQAIDKAGFDRQALKLLIVIGTHPDKSILRNAKVGGRAIEDVAGRLKPDLSRPIEFYAIQVEPQSNEDLKQFGPQIQSVLTEFRGRRKKDFNDTRGIGAWKNSQNPAAVESMVLERFNKLKKKNEQDQQQLRQAIRGDWDTRFTDALKRELKDQDIDPDQLRDSAIDFYECYVWGKNKQGQQQIRPWVLMKETELLRIRDFVQAIVRGARGRQVNLGKLVTQLVQTLVGAKIDPNEPVDDIIKKKMGITVQSTFLKRPPNQIALISVADLEKLQQKLKNMDLLIGKKKFYKIPESPLNWFWVDVEEQLP
jgi:hypothetical protein